MSDPTFSTGDLRSAAVDYHRDHEHRRKWAYGQSYGPGRQENENHARPARPMTREQHGIRRDGVPVSTFKARNRQAHKRDIVDYSSGADSADDDVTLADNEPLATPTEPADAEITYSFDAARGPSHGSQILTNALDAALERYEVRATDRLIKEEYEVLDGNGEPVATRAVSKGKKGARGVSVAVPLDGEDFELV